MQFIVEGRCLQVISEKLQPALQECVGEYGHMETLTALLCTVLVEVGADNARKMLDSLDSSPLLVRERGV